MFPELSVAHTDVYRAVLDMHYGGAAGRGENGAIVAVVPNRCRRAMFSETSHVVLFADNMKLQLTLPLW